MPALAAAAEDAAADTAHSGSNAGSSSSSSSSSSDDGSDGGGEGWAEGGEGIDRVEHIERFERIAGTAEGKGAPQAANSGGGGDASGGGGASGGDVKAGAGGEEPDDGMWWWTKFAVRSSATGRAGRGPWSRAELVAMLMDGDVYADVPLATGAGGPFLTARMLGKRGPFYRRKGMASLRAEKVRSYSM